MKSARSVCFVSILVLLNSLCESSLSADYKVVSISYRMVSSGQSLPVVQNATRELMRRDCAFEYGGGRTNQQTAVPVGKGRDSELAVLTNDPKRLASESAEIFETLGFFPGGSVDQMGSSATDPIYASFFGNLLFLYGGPLPAVVMKKSTGTGEYEYLSHAPVTAGRVVQQFLGDRPVFWFNENTADVTQRPRSNSPTAARLVLWDEFGRLTLRVRYSAIEWNENTLEVSGNTAMFGSACAPESSAVMCWGKSTTCQLSLLDPVSWEPTVLQTTIIMGYVGENLQIDHVRLALERPRESKGGYLACEDFRTRADVFDHPQFGVCGRNLQGIKKWRCLGSSQAYLRESREASQRFWIEVGRLLQLAQGSPELTMDSGLMRALASLNTDAAQSAETASVPVGLGHLDALSMVDAVMPQH